MNTQRLWLVVLADSAVWAGWSTAVGYAAHRLPMYAIDHDTWLTRIRGWEREGRTWDVVRIRRWKDWLPDFGEVWGGTSKRHVPGWGVDDLERFAAETRRAELVHWAIPLALPVFALWNPRGLFTAMAGYTVVANAPCLLVQRYNRARVERLLARAPRAREEAWIPHVPTGEPEGGGSVKDTEVKDVEHGVPKHRSRRRWRGS